MYTSYVNIFLKKAYNANDKSKTIPISFYTIQEVKDNDSTVSRIIKVRCRILY